MQHEEYKFDRPGDLIIVVIDIAGSSNELTNDHFVSSYLASGVASKRTSFHYHYNYSIAGMRRIPAVASSSSSRSSLPTLVLLLLTLLHPTNAGIFYGGATSSEGCYGALQSSTKPNENTVDKDGYVTFINTLSDNAFTSLQYNEGTGEWGQYPVTKFEELPTALKEEFYTHACGGPYVICANAYLYTNGMNGNGSTVLDPQQVVYLFEVCKGVEEAIEEATAAGSTNVSIPPPTPTVVDTLAPTPTIIIDEDDGTLYTGEIPMNLTYQAAVSSLITVEDLNMANSTIRGHLLDAMTTWSRTTARQAGFGVAAAQSVRRNLKGIQRRILLVYPEPLVEANGTKLMHAMEAECRKGMNATIEATDHCIEVTTELTIQFMDEPSGSQIDTLYQFEEEFESDIQDGTFLGFISPPSTKQEFRAIYPPTLLSELFEHGDGGGNVASLPSTIPESETTQLADSDTIDKLIQDHDNATESSSSENENSNTAGIVSAVCIGLILIGITLFVVRRRRVLNSTFMGIRGFEKKEFSPTDDLEEGNARGDGGSKHSSRDEFSSGESDDSSSMQSYSSSENSSQSSESSQLDDSSQSNDDSSASSRSEEYDDRVNPYQKSDPNTANDVEGLARNVSRRQKRLSTGSMSSSSKSAGGSRAADDDSSAGSSGWDSSDGNSSVDTSLADSYTGDLSSSHSGRSDDNTATNPDQLPPQVGNLLTQRNVTMIGVDEGLQEDVELTMISSESTSTDMTARDREQNPRERDIQEAIEKGDWTAVGATAAILASTSSTGVSNVEMDDTATMTTKDSSKNSSDRSAVSSQLDDDDSRAVELAELVNSGNWDGVVAVAARYADEADEAEEQLDQPNPHNYARKGSSPSSRGYGSGTSMNDSSESGMD
ncbi:hypothetical protein ACHAXH_003039, partial [Discostella pseudostelligera]